MTVIEKLENLFKKNDEWGDENWTTPGNENPYPPRIQNTFIPYYNGKYKMFVIYFDKKGEKVVETVNTQTLWDATCNAWFDCTDIDGCIDLLETWVSDYYEEYFSGEAYTGKIEVKSELRRKQ